MYRAARGERGGLLLIAGLIILCLAAIGLPVAGGASMERRAAVEEPLKAAIAWLFVAVLAAVGLLLLLLDWWQRAAYNPNSLSEEERLAWGQRVSLTPEVYEQLLRQAGFHVPKVTLFDNLLNFVPADEIASAATSVTCEKCQRDYVCSPQIEVIAPCPHCGQVQKDMWQAASSGSWLQLLLGGLVCLGPAGFCLFSTVMIALQKHDRGGDRFGKVVAGALIITALVGGGGLLLWLSWRHRHSDNLNNWSLKKRLEWAARRSSLTLEEYEWMLEQARQDQEGEVAEPKPGLAAFTPQATEEEIQATLDRAREDQKLANRRYGWWYVILGPILFAGGLASLIDVSHPRIYLVLC